MKPDTLAGWVHWALRPARRGQRRVQLDSYSLKHVAERHLGTYVKEDDFKAAMLGAGYAPIDARALSWCFRVAWRQPEGAYGEPF